MMVPIEVAGTGSMKEGVKIEGMKMKALIFFFAYHFCDSLLVAGIVRLDKTKEVGRTYRSGSTIVEP